MKIAYLTLESYQNQPIIRSQVINLFKSVEDLQRSANQPPLNIVLFTFEDIAEEEIVFEHPQVTCLKHIGIKNRGVLKNILHLYKKRQHYFNDVDIIHVRSYLPMIPALLNKYLYKKKIIFDMRGVLPEETRLRKSSTLLYSVLLLLEKIACRYSDKVVVVSNAFAGVVLKRNHVNAENVIVIPTFSSNSVKVVADKQSVPDIRKQLSWMPDTLVFVYSGAFEKWQCSEQIVSFMKEVHQKMPQARFVILSKHVKEFSDVLRLNMADGLYYVDNAPNEKLTDYLSQCNYGLLFREKNIINKVAAPIKFKDYLSAGIPVIVTDGIGDYSSYIQTERLGFILEDMSLQSFEKVIFTIQKRQNYFNSREIILAADRLFDVEKAARGYLNLYKDLKL